MRINRVAQRTKLLMVETASRFVFIIIPLEVGSLIEIAVNFY